MERCCHSYASWLAGHCSLDKGEFYWETRVRRTHALIVFIMIKRPLVAASHCHHTMLPFAMQCHWKVNGALTEFGTDTHPVVAQLGDGRYPDIAMWAEAELWQFEPTALDAACGFQSAADPSSKLTVSMDFRYTGTTVATVIYKHTVHDYEDERRCCLSCSLTSFSDSR